jgi:small-conductance mechanosensitive channel
MIFENSFYNELFYAGIILLSVIVLTKIVLTVIGRVIKKTRTDLDDKVYRKIKGPLFIIISSVALYASLHVISLLKVYFKTINKAFSVWFILIGAFFTIRLLDGITENFFAGIKDGTKKSKLDKTIAPFIEKLISLAVYIITGLMMLRMFNIEITPLLASLGIASLAVALALQDTLASFFASIYVVVERPINVGDYIKLETGEEGYVESISWRNSTIRTLPGNRIVIPNSKISKMIITNYYYPSKDMAVVLQCGVAYDSDLKKVEKVTIDVAKKTLKAVQGGHKEFEPFIRYHTFGDSNIEFSIILRVNEYVDKYLVTHEFIKNLMEAYKKNKIEISFPARNIYMRK